MLFQNNRGTNSDIRVRASGILFTVLSAVGFGVTPIMAAGILNAGMDSVALAFWRCVLVLPILLGMIMLSPNGRLRISRSQCIRILILALGGAVLTGVMLISSYTFLETGTATTLNFTYPIFVLLLGALFFRQRVVIMDIACFTLCALGVFLLCGLGGSFSWRGFCLALGSGLVYGAYVLYLEHSQIMEDMPMLQFTFYYFLFGAVMLFPLVLLKGELFSPIGASMWGETVLYAVLCGFLCTFALQLGVERIGSKTASLLSTIEPVVSLLTGMFILKETVTVLNWIGAVVILVSAVLLVLNGEERARQT